MSVFIPVVIECDFNGCKEKINSRIETVQDEDNHYKQKPVEIPEGWQKDFERGYGQTGYYKMLCPTHKIKW